MNPSMIRNNDIKRKTECITKCVMRRCHRGCGGFEGMVGGGGFLGGPCEGRTGGRPGMGGGMEGVLRPAGALDWTGGV